MGGSFTGNLTANPAHRRDLRRDGPLVESEGTAQIPLANLAEGSDRARRIRDAVEAALSDIILLGTEEHVRLASHAAQELVAGHPVHTHNLVVSLRDFIREALDLAPIPAQVAIPTQGPTRPSGSAGRGKGSDGKDGGRQGAGGGSGGMGMGGGMGGGMGAGIAEDPSSPGPRS